MDYISTKEASKKWGISTSRITLLANDDRIPGAYRLGKSWLIPADADKPKPRKAVHRKLPPKEVDTFSFPLYHFRPDWSTLKETRLSKQQYRLLKAETAVMECRFEDAFLLLQSILKSPNDIYLEIGALWNAGICCIALNNADYFSIVYLRLQTILSEDFPHRDDLTVILNILKTYIVTMGVAAHDDICNIDIHEHGLPLACLQNGYSILSKEAMKPRSADTTLMELNLRYLNTTSAIAAVEMMHCHLLGIYYLRQDMEKAEKHANAVVEIAFKNKLYFPLVTYYRYFTPILSSIVAQYPEDFQIHCNELASQYEVNFDDFITSLNGNSLLSKITNAEYPFVFAVLNDLPTGVIAQKIGVSKQTANRRLKKIYEKFGVTSKKELIEFMHNYL